MFFLHEQCDQIGQFFALWASIQSRWQQIFYPNCTHCLAIFVKVSKAFILLVKSFLATFFWSHWPRVCLSRMKSPKLAFSYSQKRKLLLWNLIFAQDKKKKISSTSLIVASLPCWLAENDNCSVTRFGSKKVAQMLPKVNQILAKQYFLHIMIFFEIAEKVTKLFVATLVSNFVVEKFGHTELTSVCIWSHWIDKCVHLITLNRQVCAFDVSCYWNLCKEFRTKCKNTEFFLDPFLCFCTKPKISRSYLDLSC